MALSIRRSSLTDQVTEAILELIEERNLREGDALPGTSELAEMLGVSVPVIREAAAGLAAVGMIKRQQGRESVVSTPDSTHMARLFSLRVLSSNVDDEGLQEFREIVEVGNARLAARNRDDADLVALDDALTHLRQVSDAEQLHAADVIFHAAVASSAKNDLCELTLEALEPVLWRLRRRVWTGWVLAGGDLQSIVEAHSTILEAIRTGDEDGAAQAMAAHLLQARRGLEEKLVADGPLPEDLLAFTKNPTRSSESAGAG